MAYMDYLNRNTLVNNSSQVLTSFDWDIEITFSSTYAPYHPSIDIIKQRLLSVDGLKGVPEGDVLEVDLRGFKIIQPGLSNVTPQDITLRFQDFEDQSITAWGLDWRAKQSSWRNKFSYRKEDVLINNMVLYQLNSDRQPVAKWACYSGILSDVTTEDTGKNNKDPLGEVSIAIKFEFIDPILMNV